MCMCKGESDLLKIIQELEKIAYRWYHIGLTLGLLNSTLENIKSKEHEDNHDLLRGVIVEWLKMNYDTTKFGPPTWRRIVEAVRATTGGKNPALADRLASKYNCGKKLMLTVAENQAPFNLAL